MLKVVSELLDELLEDELLEELEELGLLLELDELVPPPPELPPQAAKAKKALANRLFTKNLCITVT